MLQTSQNAELFSRAERVIPGGVSSPVRAFRHVGANPLIIQRGEGALLWDEEGKSYIDYCCSWGALMLGHAHPRVVRAASEQVAKGSSFGLTTALEEQLASRIISHLPSIEKIRFVSSGTEATMSALRLARGATKRSLIVKFNGHYHGHADQLLIQAGSGVAHLNASASSDGVPEEAVRNTISLPFNDLDVLSNFFQARGQEVAAVILEPIVGNMGLVPGTPAFIHLLRQETAKSGAILIFDEVITGFRIGLSGAQGLYQIDPDLTCLGKIIGGGFPLAAFGGKARIMDLLAPLGGVYQAGTLSGNPVAVKAGLETLQEIEKPGFYEALQDKMDRFLQPVAREIQRRDLPVCLNRKGSFFTLFFGVRSVVGWESLGSLDKACYGRFFRALLEKGIFFPPSPYEACFISAAHTDEQLQQTTQAILDFLAEEF